MEILGPYTRKQDGRKYVVVRESSNDKWHTISYPKFLMEQHLGIKLTEDETVDHKNRDKTDDRIENLQILSRSVHAKKDARRVRLVEITCIWCGVKTYKVVRYLKHNEKQQKSGPFCSKTCSGKYGAELQNNRTKKLDRTPTPKPEYYYLDDLPT